MSHLFYGVAYYDEYMPEDRLASDIALMRETGINVVRIAESTWSTLEPEEGQYNFYHIDRVLEAMHEAGIAVIVGTPTYAVPAWLAAKHPDILVTTVAGQQKYGPRQIMDIVNPTFRRYAEKIIRTLMAHVQHHPAIIGWQLDNETKHYDNIGRYMQEGFVRSLQEKYPDLRQLNHDFGLDYWSNRIDRWQDFPPVENTINASLACAFSRYQRQQVTEYLAWQAEIVREYAQPHQFVTHNFDFEWRGYSYGVQPRVDHFAAAQALVARVAAVGVVRVPAVFGVHAQGHAGCLHLVLKATFNLSIKGVALLDVQFFCRRGRQGNTNGLGGGILRHGWGRSAKAQQQGVAGCRGFKRGHKLGAAVGFVAAQVHGGSNGARAGQHKGYIRVGGQLSQILWRVLAAYDG